MSSPMVISPCRVQTGSPTLSDKSKQSHSIETSFSFDDGSEIDAAHVQSILSQGKGVLHSIRLKVAYTMMAVGISCLIASAIALYYIAGQRRKGDWISYVVMTFLGISVSTSLTAFLLVPLPDSLRLTQTILVLSFFFALLFGLSVAMVTARNIDMARTDTCHLLGRGVSALHCWWYGGLSVPTMVSIAVVGGGAIKSLMKSSAYDMQEQMWRCLRCAYLFMTLTVTVDAVFIAASLHTLSKSTCSMPGWLLGMAMSSPRRREYVRSRLARCCEGQGVKAAAASIAGLVGDCPSRDVIEQAKARFRRISCASLSQQQLATNAPDVAMFQLTVPSQFGECDAFISHSWHDSPVAKWGALQRWRKCFIAKHQREPKVWLDKCCIDQTDIQFDLRCLPIFLSGCRELVILCGTTYLSRLWCILELFTFVHVQGESQVITLLPVLRDGREVEDMAVIERSFRQFDARLCDCFKQSDRKRILTIINSAFGGMDGFNDEVKQIFKETGLWQPNGPDDVLESSEASSQDSDSQD